jgi:hypothetical protein
MFGRRGQGAMEYLMTYGWAILVVMIVGIVMWQLGIFNMGSTALTSSGFSKIKPQLAGSGVDHSGEVKLIFTNGVGTTIELDTMTIIDEGGGVSCNIGNANLVPSHPAAGQNIKVSYIATDCVASGSAGDVYNIKVSFDYDVVVGGITTSHSDFGTIRGPYE